MYEQYTDKQIVEMLKPKSAKLGWGPTVDHLERYPSTCEVIATIYRSAYIRGQLGRSFIIGEKKTKEPVNPFKVGDKVKFLGISYEDVESLSDRRFYPPVNIIGKVVELNSGFCFVQWPKGATYSNGALFCPNNFLEKVTERWVPATRDSIKVGSKVRFKNEQLHKKRPQYFPCKGTVGKVRAVCKDGLCDIQWPKGTTSDMDWWVTKWEDLEVLLCE